ncbi:hypothetical protein D3C76_1326400 [compost metagenome]
MLVGRNCIVSQLRMPLRQLDPPLPKVIVTNRKVLLRHVDDEFVQYAALSLSQVQGQFPSDVAFLLYQLIVHGIPRIHAETGKQPVARIRRLP